MFRGGVWLLWPVHVLIVFHSEADGTTEVLDMGQYEDGYDGSGQN